MFFFVLAVICNMICSHAQVWVLDITITYKYSKVSFYIKDPYKVTEFAFMNDSWEN